MLPLMKSSDWLWAYWFGPFFNPVDVFTGAVFATLPCLAIGCVFGLVARVKEGGR